MHNNSRHEPFLLLPFYEQGSVRGWFEPFERGEGRPVLIWPRLTDTAALPNEMRWTCFSTLMQCHAWTHSGSYLMRGANQDRVQSWCLASSQSELPIKTQGFLKKCNNFKFYHAIKVQFSQCIKPHRRAMYGGKCEAAVVENFCSACPQFHFKRISKGVFWTCRHREFKMVYKQKQFECVLKTCPWNQPLG